jgi:CO/xanthine dehydrogenase Mo-binding subunit
MVDLKVVGKAVTREDGHDKVSGRTLYTADVHLPGLLWGRILRSPYPHARIERIDTCKAQAVT